MKGIARAKVNWTLEVLGKRPDGYHELRSIVLPVSLHDDVEIERTDDGSVVVAGCEGIAQERNLAFIAALRLRERCQMPRLGAKISIVKRIPSGAGLGGGSSDAAAVLRMLNELWGVGLGETELLMLAAEVGSDVPALVLDSPVMMEGRGERVRRLTEDELAEVPRSEEIVLLSPPVFSSTAAVYAEFRPEDRGHGRNDLQPAAMRLYPQIGEALADLEARGLSSVAMSGSGSTVYGLCRRNMV